MQQTSEDKKIQLLKTLGRIVKAHREKQNKTIYAISAESSISKSTWREVEIGACKDINLTTLWKIAEGLDISPQSLIEELNIKMSKNFSLIDYD